MSFITETILQNLYIYIYKYKSSDHPLHWCMFCISIFYIQRISISIWRVLRPHDWLKLYTFSSWFGKCMKLKKCLWLCHSCCCLLWSSSADGQRVRYEVHLSIANNTLYNSRSKNEDNGKKKTYCHLVFPGVLLNIF